MLAYLQTIHKPESLEDAIHLLTESGVRPLYGGVALHRESPRDVTAVVDLSGLNLDQHRIFDTGFSLGSMMTLEAARQTCLELAPEIPNAGFVAEILLREAPINLRNTMTLGDVLVERRPNSVLLTALTALDAQIDANGWPRFIHDWFDAPIVETRHALITAIALEKGEGDIRYAFEKVARTPEDAPIVGAVAAMTHQNQKLIDARLALCGVAEHPIPLAAVDEALMASNGNIEKSMTHLNLNPPGDHWGSSDYRQAMADVLVRRVLQQTLNTEKQ